MALDNQQKRMAVPGVGRPWMRAQYPVATPTVAWRSSIGNVYPVVDFGVVIFEAGCKSWNIKERSVIWATPTRGIRWDVKDRKVRW